MGSVLECEAWALALSLLSLGIQEGRCTLSARQAQQGVLCQPQPRFLLGHNRVKGEGGAAAADQKSRSGAVGWIGVGRQCAYTSGLHPLYP